VAFNSSEVIGRLPEIVRPSVEAAVLSRDLQKELKWIDNLVQSSGDLNSLFGAIKGNWPAHY
jgi:hypothetical protein